MISAFEGEHTGFALATPDGTHVLRIRLNANHYSLATRQEVCAMVVLNMLRRQFNNQDIVSEYGWIEVAGSLTT